ncbi:Dabb family protein [Cupriavidus lacunae]|uniref:Dabb family protein n=1 Tax=Cupriavidus lacunae TaxID=2666307 RepID=UPI00244D4B80|nr:Dabb family protein [Cupriavidus lacunae]
MDTIKHIVMWKVAGDSAQTRATSATKVKRAFEALRGRIPGLQYLEVGVDFSAVDYACDMVLYTEFDSQASLDAYAKHPDHLRVREELEGLRIARYQVDYVVAGAKA